MTATRDITTCVQQLKLSLSVENYYPNTPLQSMTSVWNSRNDQRERKKRKIEKKKLEEEQEVISLLALVELSVTRAIREIERLGTCGLKVVVLDEKMTMLAMIVVTTKTETTGK
jgi:hypothetical protein